MDFTTSHATPVSIKIDGKAYEVPRFLLPQMKQWAASQRKRVEDNATAHLGPDDKARFLTFYQPPPVDIFDLAAYARSPEGVDDILSQQLKVAGVPDETIRNMLDYADPRLLATLSDQVTSAARAAASAHDMTDAKDETGKSDPLQGQPGASSGSPGTGATSGQISTPATAA